MTWVKIDKVTLNIGVGAAGQALENARVLLEKISGAKPVITKARSRNPTFKIKKGDDIGVKVTLRKQSALEVLKRCLAAVDNMLSLRGFDSTGNFSFGVKEYIDVSGVKYDPKIGMLGFDVAVSLYKPGYRVQRRRVAYTRIPRSHRVSKAQAIEFAKSLGVRIKEEVAE